MKHKYNATNQSPMSTQSSNTPYGFSNKYVMPPEDLTLGDICKIHPVQQSILHQSQKDQLIKKLQKELYDLKSTMMQNELSRREEIRHIKMAAQDIQLKLEQQQHYIKQLERENQLLQRQNNHLVKAVAKYKLKCQHITTVETPTNNNIKKNMIQQTYTRYEQALRQIGAASGSHRIVQNNYGLGEAQTDRITPKKNSNHFGLTQESQNRCREVSPRLSAPYSKTLGSNYEQTHENKNTHTPDNRLGNQRGRQKMDSQKRYLQTKLMLLENEIRVSKERLNTSRSVNKRSVDPHQHR